MEYTILIVEDHPLIIKGYINTLKYNSVIPDINFLTCNGCQTAYDIISKNEMILDMLIVDYSIPPYIEQKLLNGEDIAILVKKKFPNCKIVMITSHTEAFLIYNIVKKIDLDGFLTKADFDDEQLLESFEDIVTGGKHYSLTVENAINAVKPNQNIYLDEINRKIIQLLYEGLRTQTIADKLGLAKITVDKRKAIIKDLLDITSGGDESIVREAKRLGYI